VAAYVMGYRYNKGQGADTTAVSATATAAPLVAVTGRTVGCTRAWAEGCPPSLAIGRACTLVEEIEDAALAPWFDGTLGKPFRPEQLQDLLSTMSSLLPTTGTPFPTPLPL
jgi:hypothetical protein